jgi:hypothetical protein
MTAYELANYLEIIKKGHTTENVCSQAATMLRNQANRIAELERKHQEEFNYAEKLLKERQ